MRRYPALGTVRVGCVQYLNSKPLIHGCDAEIHFDHPSGLARDLIAGALDVALVPVFDALRDPPWLAVDDVAIACDGPVFSVFLAHRKPLREIRRIAVDPASRTSAHLLEVVLAEYHDLHPEWAPVADGEADGLLLIGNQAIDFRVAHPPGYTFLDLGEEWHRCTGLPFVFAVWLMRPSLANAPAIADELRAIKRDGIAHLPEIVRAERAREPELTRIFHNDCRATASVAQIPEAGRRSARPTTACSVCVSFSGGDNSGLSARYLTEHIRFGLGPREKTGLAKFRELLEKYRLIEPGGEPLRFV